MRITHPWLRFSFALLILCPGSAACSDDDSAPQGAVEPRDDIQVVWLRGTPYEMGQQHAALLYTELVEGRDFVDDDFLLSTMLDYAETLGLGEVAEAHSYDSTLQECQGLVDGLDGVWTLHECLILNYGDVIVEQLKLAGLGCSQFVAKGAATASGEMIHGRNLDWWEVEFISANPVIFVREPDEGIPWVAVGFPANMSPYTGMNAMGLAMASNEVNAPLESEVADSGRSHVQMVREVLRSCATLEEAEAFFRAQDHAPAETLVVSDGPSAQAAAFEMTANSLAVRPLSADGVVVAANHFVHPDMEATQEPEDPCTSSHNRLLRLTTLLEPGGPESLYGALDVPGAISILRDTYDPCADLWHDPTDDAPTLANNGAMQSVVFLPDRGVFYVAFGAFPSTMQRFVGFDMHELLTGPGYGYPTPESYPPL